MLVLCRRLGQSIVIGDNIIVRIQSLGPERVRIAIQAPPEVPVFRAELLRTEEPAEPAPEGGGS